MLNQSFFIKNQYLSNCDLINKYNLRNIYQKPKLNKIILDFSLKNFIDSLNIKENQERFNEIQIKSFLFLYLLTGAIPLINNKLIVLKNKEAKENVNYSLKFSYGNDSFIYNFLFFFFIENWSSIFKENKNILSVINKKKELNLFNLKIVLPTSVFSEIDYILNNSTFDLNPKELNLNINFLISIPQKNKNLNSVLKNLPLFWISG
jgi:hypothetical protein